MFWEYKRDSKPAELKREFEAVEEAAASMGIKLYCRDLVRILKPQTVQDPDAEFFLACYAHNNLPYRAYTINGYVSTYVIIIILLIIIIFFFRRYFNMPLQR